jgi:hypothetical protein
MIYSNRLNNIQKVFLVEMITRSKPPTDLKPSIEILGAYKADFIKQVVQFQKQYMNEKGIKVADKILEKLEI